MSGPFKYYAFVSYNGNDSVWAEWLIQTLEGYVLPAELRASRQDLPERLSPVCRDRDAFAAGPNLSAIIESDLRQSGTMIVVCSPRAVRSQWVDNEIRFFKKLGRGERIFALIVDGEPNASDAGMECIPPALRDEGASTFTGLAADVRPGKDGRDNALLKLVAGILKLDFDSLKQRDLHRRKWQAYREALARATHLLEQGHYSSAGQTLLGVAEGDRRFDHRHWEWGFLLLKCHLDLFTFECASSANCLSLSPDGRYLAAGFMDGQVRVWAMPSGDEVCSLAAHTKPVNDLDWADGGKTLLTAGGDRMLRLWDAALGTLVREFAVPPTVPARQPAAKVFWDFTLGDRVVSSARFNAEGTLMAAASGAAITLLDRNTGESRGFPTGSTGLVDSVVSDDAHAQVVAVAVDRVVFMERTDGKVVKAFMSPGGHQSLGWGAGRWVVTGSSDALHLWSAGDGGFTEEKVLRCANVTWRSRALAFDSEGKHLLAATGPTASLWNLNGSGRYLPEPQGSLGGHDEKLSAVALSRDGRFAVTGGGDRTVKLWETGRATPARRPLPGDRQIMNARFSPRGDCLAVGDYQGSVEVYRVGGTELEEPILSTAVEVLDRPLLAWAPDGGAIAIIGDLDPQLQVWSLAERRCVASISLESRWHKDGKGLPAPTRNLLAQEGGRCRCLDLDSWGRVLVASPEGALSVFELDTQRLLVRHDADRHGVVGVAWSPVDSDLFFSMGVDGQLCRWSLATGGKTGTWELGQRAVCGTLIPHRDAMAIGCADGSLKWVDLTTQDRVRSAHAHERAVSLLVASADGARLVTGGEDGFIKVFSTDELVELLSIPAKEEPQLLDLSPDGRTLLYATLDEGMVFLESLSPQLGSEQSISSWKRQRLQERYTPVPGPSAGGTTT